ncbi:Clavaminate synthase-like protein [Aspergillus minisclerotigenes]|uniref:Clavaminate synthase-like protein n=1 Tax=Aspergillus minisclerotigenes TaxID=656917 RepID=A0A5N6J6D5_9EURO|nr:Clavaminate synthase-like protein [Aspergillus minisclerotigenes]
MSTTAVITQNSQDMASIKSISMERILTKEPASLKDLLEAAQLPGFFYIDLDGASTTDLVDAVPEIFTLVKEYFCQPEHEKMKNFNPNYDRGYKKYADHESFEVALDDHSNGLSGYPGFLQKHKDPLMAFSEGCHKLAMHLLSALSDGLMRHGPDRFENNHRPEMSSDSGFKVYCAPTQARQADVRDNTHTDGGTLTLMFIRHQCMQLKNPLTNEYQWIEHRPGQMLVNVANSLQEQSNDQLHSCPHRVTQPGDGVEERYLLSYFLRPDKVA